MANNGSVNALTLDNMSISELRTLERSFSEKYGKCMDAWDVDIYNQHAKVVNTITARLCGITREELQKETRKAIETL